MKISALKTHLVQLPFEKPIKTSIHMYVFRELCCRPVADG